MMKLSKPLTAEGVIDYHKLEYSDSKQAYYSQSGEIVGTWQGKLAEHFGLSGGVDKEHFERLANGQHPLTGEQLIRIRKDRDTQEYAEHRAALDATISAPKSVSATALVGGDDRVRQAHEESATVAAIAFEAYVQARLSDNRRETTAEFVAARFRHDTSRPVEGGTPAPQLHDHFVVMNMTRIGDKYRSLQPSELYRIQSYVTAVYRAELIQRLEKLGYRIEYKKGGAFEIAGYTSEYLKAISPRSERIKEQMAEKGLTGAEAAEKIAVSSREAKQLWDRADLRQKHREQAAEFGNQPDAVVREAAKHKAKYYAADKVRRTADAAIDFARKKLIERNAVFDHYEVVREALKFGRGALLLPDAEAAFERQRGEFEEVGHYRQFAPGHRYTTPRMIEMEREVLQAVVEGKNAAGAVAPLLTREAFETEYRGRLNDAQMRLAYDVLTSPDRIIGVQGAAGVGKTHTLAPIRKIIESNGYEVVGVAPTSGAATALGDAGIANTQTLQRFVGRQQDATAPDRVVFLDESSLAATAQVHKLFDKIRPQDRVVLVGDVRQHQSVEAGRIFEELQQAGMSTFHLNKQIRQKDPELLKAVEAFNAGDVRTGVTLLDEQRRIHEHPNQKKRHEALAEQYAKSPGNTRVVSPDNESRLELNAVIRAKLQDAGHVAKDSYQTSVLRVRQDLTLEDKFHAFSYEPGDVVRYAKGNPGLGFKAGDRATVASVDHDANTITVEHNGHPVTYSPREAKGVQVYAEERREFSVGDTIQFTEVWRGKRIDNRDLATITYLDEHGNARARLERTGRGVSWNMRDFSAIDHGYVSTSYSLQGGKADNVLIDIAAGDSRTAQLVDEVLANVAVSRAVYNAEIFTDSKEALIPALERVHEKSKALAPEEIRQYRAERELAMTP